MAKPRAHDDAEYLKSETSHNKLPGSIIVLSDDLT